MADLLKIDRPVIVEGKHDKIKLSAVIDADIITTDGFQIFNSDEKRALILRLADKKGIIVLTDSDGAGLVIRNHFASILPKDKVTNLYIPEIIGKEKRKAKPSKAGTLGVEGMEVELLRRLFEPFASSDSTSTAKRGGVTKTDFFIDRLSGSDSASERRKSLARLMGLPQNISTNALIEAVNMLYTYDEYKNFVGEIDKQ